MEQIALSKKLGLVGRFFIAINFIILVLWQFPVRFYAPALFTMIVILVSAALFFLINYIAIRSVFNIERHPTQAGIGMLVYGLVSLLAAVAGSLFTLITAILFIVAGILALTGANAANANRPPNTYPYAYNQPQPFYPQGQSQPYYPFPGPANYAKGTYFNPSRPFPDYPTASAAPYRPQPVYPAVTLEQAMSMAQNGQKGAAYEAFKALLQANPSDLNLMLWVAFTAPDKEEARRVVARAGQIQPGNPTVLEAEVWLEHEQAAVK